MTVTTITYEQIEGWLGAAFFPFLRIGACLMTAPLFSANYVPPRIRIVLAILLTFVVLPLIPRPQGLTVLSGDGVVTTVQQLVIGAALGFIVQMIFEAINFGGQMIANGMGMGLAATIDPTTNAETPALGQLYTMLGSLTFLALDGHLALIDTLVSSFKGLPVGPAGFSMDALHALSAWGDELFSGALRVALPGITAMMVINLAFGAISRAAPSMNMFSVGFPITMIFGLVVVFFGLSTLQSGFTQMIGDTLGFLRELTSAR
ncbi:MAG TPA: flagellar biosynthetic protein FliR [Steroidobacteraceae bacterium]|nr:flagellar biosynthetic protein FliR [Steroidobacteraceae bacterium]